MEEGKGTDEGRFLAKSTLSYTIFGAPLSPGLEQTGLEVGFQIGLVCLETGRRVGRTRYLSATPVEIMTYERYTVLSSDNHALRGLVGDS